MVLTYSGRSAPSALKIAEASNGEIVAVRSSEGDVNWGRASANTTLNPNISNSTNKRVMRELFREHGVPMPQLLPAHNHSGYGNPVVGRPDQHSKGRGLWICNNQADIERAKNGTRRKAAATHFMEYVESDREYRVHIFKGKSIRISEKRFTDETKKEYITAKPGEINLKIVRDAAKLAVSAIGLDFGAVDILARGEDHNDQVFVLEVNAAPGLGGTMPALYSRVFLQWENGEFDD